MRGAQKRFHKISKELASQNVKFHVIKDPPKLYEFCTEILINPRVKNSRLGDLIWVILSFLVGFKMTVKRHYDLILIPAESLYDFLPGVVLSKLLRVPLLQIVHHVGPYSMFWIKSHIFRKADGRIVLSESMKNKLREYGLENNYISKNGIPLDKISSICADSSDKRYDAAYLGGIMKYKGIPTLIKSWRKVVEKIAEAKLIIMGKGSYLKEAKKLAEELNISDNIEFAGWVSEKEKYKNLKSSKLFVLPSEAEGFPLAVGEALACGVPVICSDIKSVKDNYQDCEAVIFRKTEKEKIAESILGLLDNEEKRIELKSEAKKFAQNFSWAKAAERDLEIFEKIIESS
ncbi:hypothetical protein AKJ52_00710 [candidate division MSBL1 archaeon SCGC-AAA382C18]|uniref:Glycosyl transferase family 1 domain-containing protein n=1 Tax=candidate division MSBL1 archaeon SCGC-AAA382C18 TaxID=1698281 RepID=A0A133VLC4_9EURY|nr:hypothetical protein AKJ52_00710 [candidate division MSBL1 archaeon SCGC-AAA382C18]